MNHPLPDVITLKNEISRELKYDNHPIAAINDHVVRVSMMTEPYPWHIHPNSDEVFLVVEGTLVIEFENGLCELSVGQLLTVPKGIRHRTRPGGGRSVNITFESAQTETVMAPESDPVQVWDRVNAGDS